MDLDEIDRRLAHLRQTVAPMSTNLFDLESDMIRTRLDQAALTGTTEARWSGAKQALNYLWQWFSQLNELLERAEAIRGKKPRLDGDKVSMLGALVAGPSIALSTADIPVSERGLLGPQQRELRCSPDELLARMNAAFGDVQAVISAAGRAWATLEARLQALNAQLTETANVAATLGPGHLAQVERLRARLAQLAGTVASDPLSVMADDFEPVAVSLQSAAQDIATLAALRDGLTARAGAARALLDELRVTMQAGADAHRVATEKISTPATPAPISAGPDLERGFDQVLASAAAGDWRAARRLLDDWTGRATIKLAEARAVLAANRAPIEIRNELRGRLDAFRAKAFRLGLLENSSLAGLYQRAHQALYQAPTDLTVAGDLVSRYQQQMAALADREVRHEM